MTDTGCLWRQGVWGCNLEPRSQGGEEREECLFLEVGMLGAEAQR